MTLTPSRPYPLAGQPRPRFAVWAPQLDRVRLAVADDEHELTRGPDGWWELAADTAAGYGSEVDYGYRLGDDDAVRPDPRSRWQPAGVHDRSRTFDPAAHRWQDQAWTGRQLAGGVIYELHIGTFTPDGTLDSAIERLDHLVDLGIDFVEVLPVNAFNGTHNWGYDGVGWFAVQHTYGGPAAYQRFVDACHQRGIGVIQDVVHNHLGPSGNYLPLFGPYLADAGASTWGAHVNLDGPDSDEVRAYILDNVAMWLRDYHVDGLRLDAVHALADHTAVHLLEEMAIETEVLSAHLGRPLTLIAESDLNDPRLITPRPAGGYGLTGQWSDDFHHAVLTNLTGDRTGWFDDFAGRDALVQVLRHGFFHDGTTSSFRGRRHGRPIDEATMPTWRLVVCTANHDQIGNRADGSRPATRLDHAQLAQAATLCLLSPFTPMLFMGEEWGATTPWAFFTSHPEAELGRLTAEGRLAEFVEMDWDPASVPDPQDPATFADSHLDWGQPGVGEHAELLAHHRALIALRRREPALTDPRFSARHVDAGAGDGPDDGPGWVRILAGDLAVVLNLGPSPLTVPLPAPMVATELAVGELAVGAVDAGDDAVLLGAHAHAVVRVARR